MHRIQAILRERCNVDVTGCTLTTLHKSVGRRMAANSVVDIDGYLDVLEREPGETTTLLLETLRGTTFRVEPVERDSVVPVEEIVPSDETEDDERYRLLIENAHAIPWEFSLSDDQWTYVGPQSATILGYSPEEWTDYEFWLARMHPDDRGWASEYCETLSARGQTHVFEYRWQTKAGEYRWVRDVVTVEMADGRPVRLRGYMIDITDRKVSEERVEQLAAEREVLLREISHRVKNSLSMLSSLLSLQASSTREASVERALEDAIRRVDAIQSVYTLLRPTAGDERVDAGPYVVQIAARLMQSVVSDGRIELSAEVGVVPVPADYLLPLGLVVNELVTNSIKYGLDDQEHGTISVSLQSGDDLSAVLTVRDDGAGFDTAGESGSGLGFTLVSTLAEQIGGEFHVVSSPAGTTNSLVFSP